MPWVNCAVFSPRQLNNLDELPFYFISFVIFGAANVRTHKWLRKLPRICVAVSCMLKAPSFDKPPSQKLGLFHSPIAGLVALEKSVRIMALVQASGKHTPNFQE